MLKLVIHYLLDDGTEGEVTADQRDFAAFELHEDYAPVHQRPFSYYRFCSWHALKREKRTGNHDYDWWKDHCIEAVDPTDEGPAEADPTSQDQSAGP